MGYFLGSIWSYALNVIERRNTWKEYEKRMAKLHKKLEEGKQISTSRPKPYRVSLLEEDTIELRNMLTKWIKPFREKIRKEHAQRNLLRNNLD